MRTGLVGVALGALLVSGCTSASTAPSSTSTTNVTTSAAGTPSSTAAGGGADLAAALQENYRRVVNTVLPSVVQINTSSGLGSGVVFDNQGHVVTNAHVVGNATQFQVRAATTGQDLPATLVGVYPPDDLAVIKVQGGNLKPAQFADSAKLQVGDIVLAMGNPLGLSGSVSQGIVSAVGRTVNEPQTQDSPGAVLADAIQTSAAINPGNSGGALVDLESRVVGIPTLAAISPAGSGAAAAPGIGFAIPASTVTDIAKQLIEQGKVTNSRRASLGIAAETVVDQSGQPQGVGIARVTAGGPAAQAGLQPGEVITAVNNQQTPTTNVLRDVLANLDVGQTVPVQVTGSNGQTRTVSVTLGELPAG